MQGIYFCRELGGRITYSANGETKLKNPDSPFKRDGCVELVGYKCGTVPVDTAEPGCLSLDSASAAASGAHWATGTLDKQARAASDSRTLSRTSKDIKMERERLRQERLGLGSRSWLTDGPQPLHPATSQSSLARLAGERARLLEEAQQMMSPSLSSNLSSNLSSAPSVGRPPVLASGHPAAFPRPGSGSQLISVSPGVLAGQGGGSDSNNSETSDSDRRERVERIIPITISPGHSSVPPQQQQQQQPSVRIIPVMVETDTDSSNTESGGDTPGSSGSSPASEADTVVTLGPLPTLPSLLAEMKLSTATAESGPRPRPPTFHHPSFANHFGLASRLRDSEHKSLFSSAGIRDSFPGFPNFGNFPSFTPLLAGDHRAFPEHRNHFRDKSKAAAIHKQRLAKSKSSVDYPSSDKQPESFR